MATVVAPGQLMTGITAIGDSTNVIQRTDRLAPCVLKVVNVGTGTPTFTFAILGSFDGATWFSVPYALATALGTFINAAITITSSATNFYLLQGQIPYTFIKTNISALTTETVAMDIL